jgi:hypothetical protein
LQLLSLICNLAFFICFDQDLSLGCVHLSYAEAGCKLNNFLSNKALFIEKISAFMSCSSKPPAAVVGVEMPSGIGVLTNLHTVGVIKATVAGLKDLKKLTQLRKLGVSGINRRNHKKLRNVVSGHGHLEYLSVWLDKDTEGIELCVQTGVFLFPDKLQRLKLHGHVDRLPEWIRVLTKLPELEVSPLQDPVLVRQLSNFQDGSDDQEIEEASSESQASSEETS